ncbi:hypothetical protein [Pseudomonas sp. KB-10]|uniref:hypothetical protein n=1 Tax=Pseudomonadaceae TaxID=135621 RepID=UPI0020120802|nr:hypothetical protein [Pseudomonas sp. KB-10]
MNSRLPQGSGRIVAASGSFLSLGLAVGPAISGGLISPGGFTLAAWGIGITVVLTLLLLIVPLASIRREHAPLGVVVPNLQSNCSRSPRITGKVADH